MGSTVCDSPFAHAASCMHMRDDHEGRGRVIPQMNSVLFSIHLPLYSPKPHPHPTIASAAIAAVSARSTLGPSVTPRTNACASSASHSSGAMPPSGPMSSPPARAAGAARHSGSAPPRVSHAKSGRA
eukprot:3624280-Prymnesium_polylepis.1